MCTTLLETNLNQYLIQSDKTDHVAIHKGKALRHIQAQVKKKSKRRKMKR